MESTCHTNTQQNNQHVETASSVGPPKPGEYSPWRVLTDFDAVKIDVEDCSQRLQHSKPRHIECQCWGINVIKGGYMAYICVEGDNTAVEDDAEGLGATSHNAVDTKGNKATDQQHLNG